ncbi:MAG TPA: tetratricopeptide repeat protein [Polyangiaceae bacterium]|nr:tetratricopeptide repeat protein [Polyangiaceae bacterium]
METQDDIDALVRRLIENPHDQVAITQAHRSGQSDPRVYAALLERVGKETKEPSLASHWYTEAANVWVTSLGDAHQAARSLMNAIERDPTDAIPADRLAALYREKRDAKALVALLERRARALAPLVRTDPELRATVVGIHEELGRLWADAPLGNPSKALDNYGKAIEYDPKSHYSIYATRELLKAAGRYGEAIPYFEMERVLSADDDRRLALYLDEADVCKAAGEEELAAGALRNAVALAPSDASLRQQLGTVVLELVRSGRQVDPQLRQEGADMFVLLAEEFPEHAVAYSLCALEMVPTNDRAIQLAIHYAEQLGGLEDVAPFAAAYVQYNPTGPLVADARRVAGDIQPREVMSAEVSADDSASSDAVSGGAAAAGPASNGSARSKSSRPARARRSSPARDANGVRASEFDSDERDEVGAALGALEPEMDEEDAALAALSDGAPPAELTIGANVTGPVRELLQTAAQLIQKNRRNEAAQKYKEALAIEPAQPVAIEYLQTFLRRTRRFNELRSLLSAAAAVEGVTYQQRASWLREVASLSEGQLGDLDGALSAWRMLAELGASDESASQLRRLLERAGRWHEVAELLRTQADQQSDLEARIALEKDLSRLHQTKLEDPIAAGEAWARIASLTPGDDVAIDTAVKLFESGERHDLAIGVITDNIHSVEDPTAKVELLTRLGTLRLESGDAAGAAHAYAEAAATSNDLDLWELAETSYLQAKQLEKAVEANNERVRLLADQPTRQAALLVKASGYLADSGDSARALANLYRATELDPNNDEYADAVEKQLSTTRRGSELPAFLLERAARISDTQKRVSLRKRAAKYQSHELGDFDSARRSYELVLQESDDAEALSLLADDAEGRGDAATAVGYLRRLISLKDEHRRVPLLLREAHLRHKGLKDLDGAVRSYETILRELDPKNLDALAALAELELQRGKPDKAAEALERQLELASSAEQKTDLGVRLADLYESDLNDIEGALRVLQIVHATDPNDFDAVQRICELSERSENWGLLARHLQSLITIEGDEEEVSQMTRRLAAVLHERLERSDEALKYLEQIADRGDEGCRQQFVSLADDLKKPVLAAEKLVQWYAPETGSPRRAHALHGAFTRLVTAGDDDKIIKVAKELARTRSADVDIAEPLERVATKKRDLDVLNMALELKVRDLSGVARAEEMVRQAEVLTITGLEPSMAIVHGERALTSVAPDRVEPLLQRLASLAGSVEHKIDVYERQTDRCKTPAERLFALSRAAQVASEQGDLKRARRFFDQALNDGVPDGGLDMLEKAARASDAGRGNRDTTLRVVLADALAAGGQGPGVSATARSALLSRAALLAHRDLGAHEKAFAWLADALVTHVDSQVLQSLNELALDLGDHGQADAVLTAALEEVFDVPSVRQLLQARAVIRKTYLQDAAGAADDLKRLHELAPGDDGILRQLEALYAELGDYRGLVQLYENQILRGRDPNARAELARRVALIWRDKLKDARETADAWRRVLRMKPGDNEAKEGIALAKRAMPFRRTPAPAQGGRRRSSSPAAAPGTGSERPGPSYPPSSQVMDHGGYALDDDEEVRDEDLALDDEVDGAYDGDDGTRGGGEDLDVDVEVDDDDEEVDPVTTVDERSVLQYAEAAGPGLRMRSTLLGASSTASGSQPAKRKGTRKRARSTADTGVHRKPNVTPRSGKH